MAHPADGNRLIVLLGGASIQSGGVPIGGRATHRHPLALLALLVTSAGRPLSRDKLIALLWPERDAESARNLLKVAVHELRKELGDASIRTTGDQLSADLTSIACDVSSFIAALDRGDDEGACDLYKGPFLDAFFLKDAIEFERWVESERAKLSDMFASALVRLVNTAEAHGDSEGALRWSRTHAAHDPYRPDVAQRLVTLLAASGDRAGAIRAAEQFAARRRDDLGITDEYDLVRYAREQQSHYTAPTARMLTNSERSTTSATATTHASQRSLIVIAAALGAIMAIGATTFVRKVTRNTSPVGTNRIAVIPLAPASVDSAMADAFADLLSARFTGEENIVPRAVDAEKLLAVRHNTSTLSVENAKTIAMSLGADHFITSEVASGTDSIVVSSRLYASSTGALRAWFRKSAVKGSSLASLADQSFIELLARSSGEPDDRIAGIVSRSPTAAIAYVSAQNAYRSAQYADAERLYARALDADTTFGAAGLGLAMANSWTTISENYGKGRDAAMRYVSSMSARDRLFATAFFSADPALGPAKPAPVHLERWEDVVEKYPAWPEARYQLGDRYYHYGRLSGLADAAERARDAFQTALQQDSLFASPLHHLVESYATLGQRNEIRAAAERYFAATSGANRDRSAIGWEVATALGDTAWLARIRAHFDSLPREELTRIVWVTDLNGWPSEDAERAVTLIARKAGTASEHEKAAITAFALHTNRGRESGARADAAELGAQFPDRPIGALWDLYLALFGTGDSTSAAEAVRQLASFVDGVNAGDHVRRDQHNLAACMSGYWHAMQGDLSSARSALKRVTASAKNEENNFAKRNAVVCKAILTAQLSQIVRAPSARRDVAELDTILLRERVPPHVILEIGTIVAARLHAAQGDTALALMAARRREHLTGDPLFLRAQLREEATYAKAVGDTTEVRRASAHLRTLMAAVK